MTNEPSPPVEAAEAVDDSLDVVFAAAFAAAVAAAFSGLAPTGTSWWDPLLVGALAAAYVVAATRAPALVVTLAAVVAVAFTGLTPWLAISVAGFGAGLLALQRPGGDRSLKAISGALSIIGLFHLRSYGFFGSSALLAGVAILAVLVLGFQGSQPATRTRWRRVLLAGVAICAVVAAVAVAMALSARGSANAGVAAARTGLDAARFGDPQAVAAELDTAATELQRANSRVSSPLTKPALLVPVVAQHVRAASTALGQGALVAQSAATAVRDANVEELSLRQGELDLEALAAMADPLSEAAAQLGQTVVLLQRDRSGWLLPPIADQLTELEAEATDVLPEARIAAEAAQVLPDMLGASGERRYLMFVGSPAEAREFGGFVAGYGLIAIDDGSLDLIESGSITDLFVRAQQGSLDDPDSYPTQFQEVDPVTFPQNLTSSPNIELIARATKDVFPELAGAPLDGVIYLDPFTLAAMTEFTGPLEVPEIDRVLDRDGVLDFLLNDQYQAFENRAWRFYTIGELARTTASAFQQADLPGPERLGSVLGPLARAGRLQIATFDDRENAFLQQTKLQRVFAVPDGIDSFAVIHTNGAPSKLDLYLQRDITYRAAADADGTLDVEVDVVLRSEIPADAPPLTLGETDGTNQVLLSLYSPHELAEVTVDGVPHQYERQQEFGFFRYALFKSPVPPNGESVIRFTLTGEAPPGRYQVGMWAQPLVNLDTVTIEHRDATGAVTTGRRTVEENWLFDPLGPN
jgi:hypothetical protein